MVAERDRLRDTVEETSSVRDSEYDGERVTDGVDETSKESLADSDSEDVNDAERLVENETDREIVCVSVAVGAVVFVCVPEAEEDAVRLNVELRLTDGVLETRRESVTEYDFDGESEGDKVSD